MGRPPRKELTPEARRRRREILIMIASAVTMLLLFYLESRIYRLYDFYPAGINLLFFALINLNIIFILTLLFLILRNVAKLVFERRRDVFGARLRIKLVSAFVAIALVPTVLFFLITWSFISDSIERWFNVQVQTSLNRALEVAQTYYQTSERFAVLNVEKAAAAMTGTNLYQEKHRDDLALFLKGKEAEFGAGWYGFHPLNAPSVYARGDEKDGESRGPPPDELLDAAKEGRSTSMVQAVGGTEYIHAVAPVYAPGEEKKLVGVVAARYAIPKALSAKTREIQRTFEEYRQQEILKSPIQTSYVILLVLISLLIFFSATWFGFFLARGLTQPVQRLAEATERVAEGDLDFQIEVEARDEFGQLVRSFNKMTADLKASKEETLQANLDLQQTNVELDQRRRYAQTVLSNIVAGVMSVGPGGVIETVNRAALRMLQFKMENPVGRRYDEMLTRRQADIVREVLEAASGKSRGTVSRQEEITAGNRILTVLVNGQHLYSDAGEHIGSVLVFDDLTELLQAQRMAAWQEVARRIAHEIKNPLTPIQLSAQRLQKRYADRVGDEKDEVFADCTNMIIRQVEEMKQLVNEFSKFARMAEIKPTPNDLNEIVGEAILLYQEGHPDVATKFERDADIPVFRFDRDQIKRVLINLLDNAVSAAEGAGGGQVVLRTRLRGELNSAEIEIADTGPGIPAEYRSRMFEPYFSTKRKGTGLGLSIVSRIVQDHKGYIRVRDNEPHGTVVSVELPLGTRKRAEVA